MKRSQSRAGASSRSSSAPVERLRHRGQRYRRGADAEPRDPPTFRASRRGRARCSPSASRASARPSRCCPRSTTSSAHLPGDGAVATRGGEASPTSPATVDERRWRAGGFAGRAASEPEALRDLFAAPGRRLGVSRFMVTVPASDAGADRRVVPARVRLPVRVWAVREVEPAEPVEFGGDDPAGTPDDLEAVADFDELLWTHQAASPSFSGLATPPREELREEWSDALGRTTTYVAVRRGARRPRRRACSLLYRRPTGDLRVPASEHRPRASPRRSTTCAAPASALALDRARAQLGARARLPLDDDRLALGQPALVALLAAPRLPAAVPPPLPRGPVDAVRLDDRALLPRRGRARGRARARRSPTSSRRASTRAAAPASSRRSASRAAGSCTSRPRRSGSRR